MNDTPAPKDPPPLKIVKPGFMDKFKSKRSPSIGGVETVLSALKVHGIADARDFVRLHPSEDEYWSCEICFVSVPVKGQKKDLLHVIEDDLATQYLPSRYH